MKLRIKPSTTNDFEYGGFLIKNHSVKEWILELQRLSMDWSTLKIYPIPNVTPNSIWGCLIVSSQKLRAQDVGGNELCQRVTPHLFIPEKSRLTPTLLLAELTELFPKFIHIIHPEFGTVEFNEPFSIVNHLTLPKEKYRYIFKPQDSVFIPQEIKSFQIKAVPNEDPLKKLEDNVVKHREKIPHKPLNIFEKLRFFIYNKVLKMDGNAASEDSTQSKLKKFFGSHKDWVDKWDQDFKELEDRNKNEIEKLIQLLERNPEEALKYAIPLNHNLNPRGSQLGNYSFSKFRSSFNWNSRNNDSNSSYHVDIGDQNLVLNNQYIKTAESLIKKGEYEKAAFVYIKLLNNYHLGAQTLENGKLYQEAATVYLKHLNNKSKAAECYTQAKMTEKAIKIYKEIEDYCKVGDLYASIHRVPESIKYYKIAADILLSQKQYIPAAMVYKNKINDVDRSQSILLEGWLDGNKNYDCLNSYFSNIENQKDRLKAINAIYTKDVHYHNHSVFLKVIHFQYRNSQELAPELRNLAYDLVSKMVVENPHIINELRKFNLKNKDFGKDAFRYKKIPRSSPM